MRQEVRYIIIHCSYVGVWDLNLFDQDELRSVCGSREDFGYFHCPSCLRSDVNRVWVCTTLLSHDTPFCSCCKSHASWYQLSTCTKPYTVLNPYQPAGSRDFCPTPPKLSYSAASKSEPEGLLETQDVYIAETLLNLAEDMGPQSFFTQYQAGFTLTLREPSFSICGCSDSLRKTCYYISRLMTLDPPTETCPHYFSNQECAAAWTLCVLNYNCTIRNELSKCRVFNHPLMSLEGELLPQSATRRLVCGEKRDPSTKCYSVDGLSSDTLQVCITGVCVCACMCAWWVQ